MHTSYLKRWGTNEKVWGTQIQSALTNIKHSCRNQMKTLKVYIDKTDIYHG